MDSALVYLVQTDTTVGFSSSNDEKLSAIKKRPNSKKILNTVDTFFTLNKNARVPKSFRKLVRNSKKTT
ncbi:Sua5 YciO YrdC YwlC family protein, partial [Aliarcobacter butzleri]